MYTNFVIDHDIEGGVNILTKLINNKLINNKLQEIINYFELEEGYNKDEIISDILNKIKELDNHDANEINLEWDGNYLTNLDDFINQFYNQIINGDAML